MSLPIDTKKRARPSSLPSPLAPVYTYKRAALVAFLCLSGAWMLFGLGSQVQVLRGAIRRTGWVSCAHMSTTTKVKATAVKKEFKLPSGDVVPGLALGVWQSNPGEVGQAVEHALKVGYRHIDGAWIYRNEAEVGAAIAKSGVARKDLWITSKLWNTFHAPEDVEAALDDSLAKLGTDYVDLYLMHWPVAQTKDRKLIKDLTENPFPTWQAMERLVEKGKARNIGVSNFNERRIANLTSNPSIKITPAINQVELNFFNPQPGLLRWAKEHNIILEAYSPLGSNNQVKESLEVPEVKAAAAELGITPAQVVLSWQAQRGVVVLAKSVTPKRIEENLELFELPQTLFQKIEAAAAAHPPKRVVNPSKTWGVDIFDEWDTTSKL